MLNPTCYAGLKADTQSRMAWADVALARALMYADCDEPTAHAAITEAVNLNEAPSSGIY
jgi:hypothetical protein